MSWSTYYKCQNTPEAIAAGAAEKRNVVLDATHSQDVRSEVQDQFDGALELAQKIATDEKLVGKAKQVHVALSGHANPKHEPRGRWSGSQVTVQVQNADEVAKEAPAETKSASDDVTKPE